jgi:hypothetical protein
MFGAGGMGGGGFHSDGSGGFHGARFGGRDGFHDRFRGGFGGYGGYGLYDDYGYGYGDSDYGAYGYDQPYASSQYWYYCQAPAGYYPYVQQCSTSWQPVPAG